MEHGLAGFMRGVLPRAANVSLWGTCMVCRHPHSIVDSCGCTAMLRSLPMNSLNVLLPFLAETMLLHHSFYGSWNMRSIKKPLPLMIPVIESVRSTSTISILYTINGPSHLKTLTSADIVWKQRSHLDRGCGRRMPSTVRGSLKTFYRSIQIGARCRDRIRIGGLPEWQGSDL